MITDIIQRLNSNHKVQSSMLKVQRINSSKFKGEWVQREKMIRGIREIRSQCLNLFYIIVKGMVGKMVKNEWFQYLNKSFVFKKLLSRFSKGAYLDFKRALVRGLKGTFCKPKGR